MPSSTRDTIGLGRSVPSSVCNQVPVRACHPTFVSFIEPCLRGDERCAHLPQLLRVCTGRSNSDVLEPLTIQAFKGSPLSEIASFRALGRQRSCLSETVRTLSSYEIQMLILVQNLVSAHHELRFEQWNP